MEENLKPSANVTRLADSLIDVLIDFEQKSGPDPQAILMALIMVQIDVLFKLGHGSHEKAKRKAKVWIEQLRRTIAFKPNWEAWQQSLYPAKPGPQTH